MGILDWFRREPKTPDGLVRLTKTRHGWVAEVRKRGKWRAITKDGAFLKMHSAAEVEDTEVLAFDIYRDVLCRTSFEAEIAAKLYRTLVKKWGVL